MVSCWRKRSKKYWGTPKVGAMAFVRCLTPDVVEELAKDESFAPDHWQVLRVADEECTEKRTITADKAVEMREAKGEAVLLLVDTDRAGAGMDGIYSAAREVDEAALFKQARQQAILKIKQDLFHANRQYVEHAIKKAGRVRRQTCRVPMGGIRLSVPGCRG